MRVEFIREICGQYGLDAEKQERLVDAFNEIQQDSQMKAKFDKLVDDLCKAGADDPVWSWDLTFDIQNKDCCKFLLLLGCVEITKEDMLRRQIPASYYEDIPGRRIEPQIKKYQATGNCEVSDFPWDRNFYTHSIFLLDRFYFIPCLFGSPFRVFRNNTTNEVVAIHDGGHDVGVDGQLVVEDNASAEVAFRTEGADTEEEFVGNYMNPCGFVSRKVMRLKKSEWKQVVKQGDKMLALHIPGGEGYTPARLQNSMQMALDFFKKYYPELDIKGFWSESWLYDNRLSFLLPAESNIVSVQRRFYSYSVGGGSRMALLEVFGDAKIDLTKAQPKTSLQRKIIETLGKGNHFCESSMIVLPEEVPVIEERYTYVKDSDLEELEQVVHSLWK